MGNQVEQCNKLVKVLKKLVQEIGEDTTTQAIEILCGSKVFSPLLICSVEKEVELEAYALGHKNQIVGLIWVLQLQRKDLRRFRKPFTEPYFEFCEPLGKRINAELELWKDCIDFIDKLKLPELTTFNTPLDGWFATTQERMSGLIPNNTKENQILLLREEIQQLNAGINPHDPDKGERELYNFINLAIAIKTPQKGDNNDLKRKRKEFRDQAWAAYIKAHQEWYRHYSTSNKIKAVCIEDEQLKYYFNGRQKRLVSPPLREDFRFRKKKSLNIGSA
jgi:hypothetical protein